MSLRVNSFSVSGEVVSGQMLYRSLDVSPITKEDNMAEIIKKQVCKCDHCGNEAEMVISCSLQTTNESSSVKERKTSEKIKGTATCSHCGNEADMWLDL